jgi:hypothetical protein
MTADEIRKMRDDAVSGRIDGSLTEESALVFFVAELSAQLAELNEKLSTCIRTGTERSAIRIIRSYAYRGKK